MAAIANNAAATATRRQYPWTVAAVAAVVVA